MFFLFARKRSGVTECGEGTDRLLGVAFGLEHSEATTHSQSTVDGPLRSQDFAPGQVVAERPALVLWTQLGTHGYNRALIFENKSILGGIRLWVGPIIEHLLSVWDLTSAFSH